MVTPLGPPKWPPADGMRSPTSEALPNQSPILPLQDGDTPLILALLKGHTQIAALLLDKGADKDAKRNVSNWSLMQTNIGVHALWEIGR